MLCKHNIFATMNISITRFLNTKLHRDMNPFFLALLSDTKYLNISTI